jgi:Biotin-lipoyl like
MIDLKAGVRPGREPVFRENAIVAGSRPMPVLPGAAVHADIGLVRRAHGAGGEAGVGQGAGRRKPCVRSTGGALPDGDLRADYAQHFETTDDAFIASRQFAVAPKVSGYITAVPVTDNQHVVAGDVVARIDDRDYHIALEQAQAQVAAAEASIQNIDAQITVQQAQVSASQAQVEQAQATLVFAQQQATRYQDLAQKGSGTVQNAQQYTSQLPAEFAIAIGPAMNAALQAARSELFLDLIAAIGAVGPHVRSRVARIKNIFELLTVVHARVAHHITAHELVRSRGNAIGSGLQVN